MFRKKQKLYIRKSEKYGMVMHIKVYCKEG